VREGKLLLGGRCPQQSSSPPWLPPTIALALTILRGEKENKLSTNAFGPMTI